MCCNPNKLITSMLMLQWSTAKKKTLTKIKIYYRCGDCVTGHGVCCAVCVSVCERLMLRSHYFLPDGGGGGANWNGECPIRPIIGGWGRLNCWAIRGWGPDGGGGACPTPTPPDPELALELLY